MGFFRFIHSFQDRGGRDMAHRSLTAKARVRSQSKSISGEQSGTGIGSSPSTSLFPSQYHSPNAPYSFLYLSPALYNLSN
jgi:hypothetical protein